MTDEAEPGLAAMRMSYEVGELDEHCADLDPIRQFRHWFAEAVRKKVPEPNAMTLATVGDDARPSTRVVLLKELDDDGLVFYTNYTSRKANDLANNPAAALQFHWVELQQVVRIEGFVTKVTAAESDQYFHQRPLDSRLGAWASPQSQIIASRAILVANAAKFATAYGLRPPRPPHWGGYRLVPDSWEFWQGRKSRLHDRLRYQKTERGWVRHRLAP